MRELNLAEIEIVSGGETVMPTIVVVGTRFPRGVTTVYPEDYELRGQTAGEYIFAQSYTEVWNDCVAAVGGQVGTGLCADTIQKGLEPSDTPEDSPAQSETFDLECAMAKAQWASEVALSNAAADQNGGIVPGPQVAAERSAAASMAANCY
jgi:hypothetical protein